MYIDPVCLKRRKVTLEIAETLRNESNKLHNPHNKQQRTTQTQHKTKLKSKPYSANKASWLQETRACAGEGGVTREEAQRNVVLRVPQ